MGEGSTPTDSRLVRLAVLEEPTRMALYQHALRRAPEAVGRDEAAAAIGVSRALASFHLDRLVAAGLLEPSFRRLTNRSGPGAGRPAKLYSPVLSEVSYSVPARRYELAGLLLARTFGALGSEARTVLEEEARQFGAKLTPGHGEAGLRTTLDEQGYEPVRSENGDMVLNNCPFDSLAKDCADTVCGMNLALLEGLVRSTGADFRPSLVPTPGFCCVVLQRLPK